jgi:hypothetical protein
MHERATLPYKESYITKKLETKYRIAQRGYGKLNRYKLNNKPRYSTLEGTRLNVNSACKTQTREGSTLFIAQVLIIVYYLYSCGCSSTRIQMERHMEGTTQYASQRIIE